MLCDTFQSALVPIEQFSVCSQISCNFAGNKKKYKERHKSRKNNLNQMPTFTEHNFLSEQVN